MAGDERRYTHTAYSNQGEARMTGDAYPLLLSLHTHTQRLVQAYERLLTLAAREGCVTTDLLVEHEQMLHEVRGIVESQRRWLDRVDNEERHL